MTLAELRASLAAAFISDWGLRRFLEKLILATGAPGAGDISVATAAELGAVDAASVEEGTAAWVESFRTYFVLGQAAFSPDGIRYIDALGLPGYQWIRSNYIDRRWKQQPEWFIDPDSVAGTSNDENDGATLLTPIATWSELMRRVTGGTMQWATDGDGLPDDEAASPIVHLNSVLVDDDNVTCTFTSRIDDAQLVIRPSPEAFISTDGLTYTVMLVTAKNRATNTLRTLQFDQLTQAGDFLYHVAHDELIYVIRGGAAGAEILVSVPRTPITLGNTLIKVEPPSMKVVNLTGWSSGAVKPIQIVNIANQNKAAPQQIEGTLVQNAELLSCHFTRATGGPGGFESDTCFQHCDFNGCTLVDATLRGGGDFSGGAWSDVAFAGEDGTAGLNVHGSTAFGDFLGGTIRSGGAVSMGDIGIAMPGADFLGIASNAVLHVIGTAYPNHFFGDCATFISIGPEALVTCDPFGASAGPWCAIATAAIVGVTGVSSANDWLPTPTTGTYPAFATLSTVAELFASPFFGKASHPIGGQRFVTPTP